MLLWILALLGMLALSRFKLVSLLETWLYSKVTSTHCLKYVSLEGWWDLYQGFVFESSPLWNFIGIVVCSRTLDDIYISPCWIEAWNSWLLNTMNSWTFSMSCRTSHFIVFVASLLERTYFWPYSELLRTFCLARFLEIRGFGSS